MVWLGCWLKYFLLAQNSFFDGLGTTNFSQIDSVLCMAIFNKIGYGLGMVIFNRNLRGLGARIQPRDFSVGYAIGVCTIFS